MWILDILGTKVVRNPCELDLGRSKGRGSWPTDTRRSIVEKKEKSLRKERVEKNHQRYWEVRKMQGHGNQGRQSYGEGSG